LIGGVVKFPELQSLGSNIKVVKDQKRSGYVVGGEYRFYLQKENKYKAPHGVYIGPYANLFEFKNERNLVITAEDDMSTSSVLLTSKINAVNLGFQMGYQFVINNRWTIDMIFIGPSASWYAAKFNLDGTLNIPEDEFEQEIIDGLLDRFPLIKELVSEESVNVRGNNSRWSGGFRYQLNVGYHFGRKKNK
jgi:hypothetical protein